MPRQVIVGALLLACVCAAAPAAAQSATLPAEIPIFPLPNVVLFPAVSRPLLIFEPRYREMIADALKGNRIIGMVLLRPGFEQDYEGRPPVYQIGCAGEIAEYEQLADGRYTIVLRAIVRFRVTSEDQRKPYRLARVEAIPESFTDPDRAPLSALRERLASLLLTTLPPGADLPPADLADEAFVNIVAQYLNMSEAARQELLERAGPLPRAQALIELLEKR